jgi:hypothetical protein
VRPQPYKVESRAQGDPGMGGTDHTIWMNRRMWAAWDVTIAELGFTPRIVQGAYMAAHGGGAKDSKGYHDFGGCIDTSVIGFDEKKIREILRVGRDVGWAVWHRIADLDNLDSDHMHWCLLDDERAASGALDQMVQYRHNPSQNGLSSRAEDRDADLTPRPVVVFDYDKYLEEVDDMDLSDPIKGQHDGEDPVTVGDALRAILEIQADLERFRSIEQQRHERLRARINEAKAAIRELPTDDQVKNRFGMILDSIEQSDETATENVPVS